MMIHRAGNQSIAYYDPINLDFLGDVHWQMIPGIPVFICLSGIGRDGRLSSICGITTVDNSIGDDGSWSCAVEGGPSQVLDGCYSEMNEEIRPHIAHFCADSSLALAPDISSPLPVAQNSRCAFFLGILL